MAIEKLQVPMGGTGQDNETDLVSTLGKTNHSQLEVSSIGNITNEFLTTNNIDTSAIITNITNINSVASIDFNRILNIDLRSNDTTYSTTSSDAYSQAASFEAITPNSPTSSLLVYTWGYIDCDNVSTNQAAIRKRLAYYDGNNYVLTGMLSIFRYIDPDINHYRHTPLMIYDFTVNERRSDTGAWLIRWYYDAYVSGVTATIFRNNWLLIEYEP